MDTLSRLFRTSMRWNTAGAIGYQSLLLAHQVALYKIMPLATYGVMSILLSLIYFGAVVADGGLDGTIAAFFHRLTISRHTFKKALVPHWLGIIALTTTLGILFGVFHARFFTTIVLSPLIVISSCLIFTAESLRRSLRMTLQLAFKAKAVALIDSGSMMLYLFFVWGAYAYSLPLTLELLMGSLAFISLGSLFVMSFFVARWQQKLSDTILTDCSAQQKSDSNLSQRMLGQQKYPKLFSKNNSSPNDSFSNDSFLKTIPQRQLIYQRLINGSNSLTHQLFSGNVLVPLVGMSSGLANAGLVKLASYLAHGLVTLSRKIVGSSGSALLSALKTAPWQIKRPAFWALSRTLYTTIFFSLIALGSMSSHLVAQGVITSQQSSILFLVVLLIISEGLCISYETLFVIEEKTLYALALNGVTGLAAGLLVFGASSFSLTKLLVLILGMRLFLFGAMALVAAHLWQLYPPLPSMTSSFLTRSTIFGGIASGIAIGFAYLCGSPLAFLLAR